ncbi:MAG TPA: chromosome segregation protein SMC [Deltaproteobacteria bacterium]|nr:chromosome segregation protein SMC [Deltaproteobacteria bacterium]
MSKKKKIVARFIKILLENWKNFAHVKIPLQRRVFLVGPNASGKSNFLDMFRFLRDLASPGGGFQEAVNKRGGVSAIRCLAARRNPDIAISIVVETGKDRPCWEYELRFHQDKQRRPLVRKEKVICNGKIVLERPDEDDRQDSERLTQTYLEQVNVNRPFRELVEVFQSVQYLHIVPQLVREPDRSIGRTRDPFGGDFLEQIAKAQERTRNVRLRNIQEALRVAVPQLGEIGLWRDERGTPHLRGKYEHWRPKGAWQTEKEFSDGTLRLMGLLWAILTGTGPLLLEEPELSLHPEIVRFLPQMFARIQRQSKRQLIVSTHSSDLLRDEGIGLDEVLLLRPTSEGTDIRASDAFEEIPALLEGGVSLAEAVIPKTRPEKPEQLTLFGDF